MKQKLNRSNRYQKILDRLAESGDDEEGDEDIDGDQALNELIQAGVKHKKIKGKNREEEDPEEKQSSKKHKKIQKNVSKKDKKKSLRLSSQPESNTDSDTDIESDTTTDTGLPKDVEDLLEELISPSQGHKKMSPKRRRRLLKKIRRELRRGNREEKGKSLKEKGKNGGLTGELQPHPDRNTHAANPKNNKKDSNTHSNTDDTGPNKELKSLLDKIFEEIPQDRKQLHRQLETLLSRLQYVALRKVEAQLNYELTSSSELVKIVKELKDLSLVSKWTKKLEKVILENPSKITPPGMKGFTLLGRVKEMSSSARNEQNKQKDMRNSGYKHSKASMIPLPKDEDTKTG